MEATSNTCVSVPCVSMLSLKHVSYKYRKAKRSALEDISLDLGVGLVGILGGMGSGKSTLLNVLVGDGRSKGVVEGGVFIDGTSMECLSQRKRGRQMGLVGTDEKLQEGLSVGKTVTMRGKFTGKGIEEVKELLDDLGLAATWDTKTSALSGGQRRRLAICLELLTEPKILAIDEATTGLDSFTAISLIKTLKQKACTGDRLIITTLHQPSSEIWNELTYLVVLDNHGRVAFKGPPDRVTDFIRVSKEFGKCGSGKGTLAEQLLEIAGEATETDNKLFYDCSWVCSESSMSRPQASKIDGAEVVQIGNVRPSSCNSFTILLRIWMGNYLGSPVLRMRLGRAVFFSLCIGGLFFSTEDMLSLRGMYFLMLAESQQEPLLDAIRKTPKEVSMSRSELRKGLYCWWPPLLTLHLVDFAVQCFVSLVFLTPIYFMTDMVSFHLAYSVLVTLTTCARLTGTLIAITVPPYFALTVGSLINFLSVISSGYLISPSSMPLPVSWLPSALYFPLAYRIFSVTQLKGRHFPGPTSGDAYLDSMYSGNSYTGVYGLCCLWVAVGVVVSLLLFRKALLRKE